MLGKTVFGLLALLTVTLAAAVAASAQGEEPGESIGGTLFQRIDGERVPVEGVVIVVSQDGTEIGSATSDAEGTWLVQLPGPGSYSVRLDESTLPEDVGLTDPDRTELPDINVTSGQDRQVIFQLGESALEQPGTFTRVAALFVVGLKLGAIIALCAIGLSLIFAVTGLVNFAHAELVTLGAVIAYLLHAAGPHWPLVAAAVPAVIAGAFLGWGQEKVLWKPLRRRRMGLLSMMVVSIGVGFALRFLILIFYGGRPRAYPDFAGQAATPILGIPVVPKQLVTIGVAVAVLGAVGLFLQKTQAGTALRAVRDDSALAESSGIDAQRVIALTWAMGGALAAMGGVFFGLTESVQWDMGFQLLLLMFAAVILGGIGTTYGTMAGAFIVGVAVEMSVLFVPSELKTAVGLVLLIIVLIFRPQGLLAVRERIS
ncbi:MAG TPA: branched-chain amino acid ABC transporter permease [Jiangellaceae bacterium]